MYDVGIIAYGMGNLRSVANACRFLGVEPLLCSTPDQLGSCRRIILPGVGAFADGMTRLRHGGWDHELTREVCERGKPFLGVCLGMQLLAAVGTEHGSHRGLGWIDGTVERIVQIDGVRIPHIGWNDVTPTRHDGVFEGMTVAPVFYFIHSYVLRPADERIVTSRCDYGEPFVSSIHVNNITATQFHPEKSQKAGLHVLKRFLGS